MWTVRPPVGFKLSFVVVAMLACGGGAGRPPSAAARPRPAARSRAETIPIDARSAERVRMAWDAAVGGFGRAVAVHRGLSKVFVATERTAVAYDFTSGQRVADIAVCPDVLRGGFAIRGDDLIVACAKKVVRLDAATLARRKELKTAPAIATAAAFGSDAVALGHRDGVVRIYPLAGGDARSVPVPGPPIDVKSLALSPDDSRIAVAWTQGSVWWWDVDLPNQAHDLVRHERESDAVAFDATGQRLAEEGEVDHTSVWDLHKPDAPVERIKNGDWIKRLHFTPDGRWLVRGGSDGLELAEIAGPRRVALDTSGLVEDVGVDEQFASLAAIDRKGRLSVWVVR